MDQEPVKATNIVGELYEDDANEWRWRVVSENGNILGDSGEGYKNKIDCAVIAARILNPAIVIVEIED